MGFRSPGIWEGGLIMPTKLMLAHPDLKTASLYIHLLKIRDGGTGVQGHPDFYRSVNSISTTGQIMSLMSTNYYLPPQYSFVTKLEDFWNYVVCVL